MAVHVLQRNTLYIDCLQAKWLNTNKTLEIVYWMWFSCSGEEETSWMLFWDLQYQCLLKRAKLALRGLLITANYLNEHCIFNVLAVDKMWYFHITSDQWGLFDWFTVNYEMYQIVPARFPLSLRVQSVELGTQRSVRCWPVRRAVYGHKLTSKAWHCHHSGPWPTCLTVCLSMGLCVSTVSTHTICTVIKSTSAYFTSNNLMKSRERQHECL